MDIKKEEFKRGFKEKTFCSIIVFAIIIFSEKNKRADENREVENILISPEIDLFFINVVNITPTKSAIIDVFK